MASRAVGSTSLLRYAWWAAVEVSGVSIVPVAAAPAYVACVCSILKLASMLQLRINSGPHCWGGFTALSLSYLAASNSRSFCTAFYIV